MEKKLWLYWSTGFKDCPKLVSIAKESIKKNAKDFEINYLCEKTVWDFISNNINSQVWEMMSEQHKSDYIRISILEKYGGLWIDGTVIVMSSLKDLLKGKCDEGFFCFSWFKEDSIFVNSKVKKVGKNRVIASWLIYSEKKNKIITKLRKEIIKYWNNPMSLKYFKKTIIKKILRRIYMYLYESKEPLRSGKNTKSLIRKFFGNSYLVINDCFANLIFNNNECKYIWDKIPKITAMKSHQMIQFLTSDFVPEPLDYYPLQKLDYRLINNQKAFNYILEKI